MISEKSTNWYVAEVILEARVEGNERNVVWTNFVLINATDNAAAFDDATAIGVGWNPRIRTRTINS